MKRRCKEIPYPAKPFVFSVARNLLINRVRREHIVSIDAVADLDALGIAIDEPGPDRSAMARQELQRLQEALDRLPPRCREAVVLRKIEGLGRREIAGRMGIAEATVAEYLAIGIDTLADLLHGEGWQAVSDIAQSASHTPSARELRARAAVWLERRDCADWSLKDQTELDEWLAQSPGHMVAFLRAEAAWIRADRFSAFGPAMPESAAPSRLFAPMLLKIAAALGLVAVLGVAASAMLSRPHERIYSTPIGGRETISFADGSRIELNTDTVLRARMTTEERVVWLDKGEAFFRIKHDAAHPFVVMVGDHRVTDLGTKFMVRRDPRQDGSRRRRRPRDVRPARCAGAQSSSAADAGRYRDGDRPKACALRAPPKRNCRSIWRGGAAFWCSTTPRLADAVDAIQPLQPHQARDRG